MLAPSASAQQLALLVDREEVLAPDARGRMDSLLNAYHDRTGNVLTFCSDSADVSIKTYQDSVEKAYASLAGREGYSIHVLVSRRHQKIQLASDNMARFDRAKFEEFMKIVSFGVPALKDGKRELGFTAICMKAMEFLDSLPPKVPGHG